MAIASIQVQMAREVRDYVLVVLDGPADAAELDRLRTRRRIWLLRGAPEYTPQHFPPGATVKCERKYAWIGTLFELTLQETAHGKRDTAG